MAFNHEKFQTICTDIACASSAGGTLVLAGWVLYTILVDPIKEKIREKKAKKLEEETRMNGHADEHKVDDMILDFDPLPDQNEP